MVKKVAVGDFVEVLAGAKAKFGLDKGTVLYITASGYGNDKPKDPYSFRLVFIGGRIVDDHLLDPDENPGVLVDGKFLRTLGEARSKKLRAILEEDAKKWLPQDEEQGEQEAAEPA
jgi:hypothetical protein